ncbi:hypothetical protein J2X16_001363 [Pelomonas aquatica]|uniref:Uncharacterized protein n=1 Tax=Pelomonas aquatica TaxID=431058 RepID=A0ABU1Z5X9_9BURK|nr:hypothetical protein [Pelomonas aquatica]MDR7296024.1 hypothetical protein [Pelomonas aquatica]
MRLISVAEKMRNKDADEGFDLEVIDGLLRSALIAYMRCFGSGARPVLCHSDAAEFGPELAERHQNFKDLRDKYVAHCVAPLDENAGA